MIFTLVLVLDNSYNKNKTKTFSDQSIKKKNGHLI